MHMLLKAEVRIILKVRTVLPDLYIYIYIYLVPILSLPSPSLCSDGIHMQTVVEVVLYGCKTMKFI